jgi:hypothetical protein
MAILWTTSHYKKINLLECEIIKKNRSTDYNQKSTNISSFGFSSFCSEVTISWFFGGFLKDFSFFFNYVALL